MIVAILPKKSKRQPGFGDRIREMRSAKNMSQVALAEALGVHAQYLSRLELGLVPNPTLPTLRKLAKALGCTIDQIVGEEAAD